jgi:hypothetical protein
MNEILTKFDMETPRSPSDLAKWYYRKYDEIKSDPTEVKKAMLHKGLYSYFVQEIYPLVIYSLWRFSQDDVRCKPKIGSQGYDAIIYPPDRPDHVHAVEVTWPQDGRNRKSIAQLMNNRGFQGRVGDEFDRYNQDILRRVVAAAEKKSLKDYRAKGGSALLIVLDTECSPLDESERKTQIRALSEDIQPLDFRVDSVFLIATPHEGIHIIKEQPTNGC